MEPGVFDQLNQCYRRAIEEGVELDVMVEYLFDNTDGIDEEDVLEFFDNYVINNWITIYICLTICYNNTIR